jgi:hypothetical protein
MKVSEFKKYIREQIIQTLKEEDIKTATDMQKAYNAELSKTKELADELGITMENKKKD